MTAPDPYGGLPHPQGPAPVGRPRPPVPPTVQNAFYAMLAGALLQALGIVLTLSLADTLRETVTESMRQTDPAVSQDVIDGVVAAALGFTIVFGLIQVALWIWMAMANRAGRNWARITATVFFGISCVSLLLTLGSAAAGAADNAFSAGSATVPGLIVTALNWLAGLAAVILLWNKRSSAYFNPYAHGGGYGPPPGYGPGHPPPPGHGYGPPPGQGRPGGHWGGTEGR
jgi:hypothetical protein